MSLIIFERMRDRVKFDKQISDTDYFLSLLYYGELLTKVVVSGLVSAVVNGNDQSQYSLKYKLVRSSGVGDWSRVLEEILTGPTATKVINEANPTTTQLNKRLKSDDWQKEALNLIHEVVSNFDYKSDTLSTAKLKNWFTYFTVLRNKTKGHGAPTSISLSEVCDKLHTSIDLIVENLHLFKIEWLYIRQNLSGKYNVVPLSNNTDNLSEQSELNRGESYYQILTSAKGKDYKYSEGIYLVLGKPKQVALLTMSSDSSDFFLPNGSFTTKKYELLSYRTGVKQEADSADYLIPPGELQPSETQALSGLDLQGKSLGNLPEHPRAYIHRNELETEIYDLLTDERNPVITMHGRGGIGKTTTALSVLHNISKTNHFDIIVWFSARDIDLFDHDQIKVKPDVLSLTDISKQFAHLIEPEELQLREFDHVDYFKKQLGKSVLDKPTIYIFDNFETTADPIELFNFINTNVRLPNKVLITTRHRDFKGDYPIRVDGMDENESFSLIDEYSTKLNISSLITDSYKKELVRQSEGHPYIIKVLLGEVKKIGKAGKIEKIIASKNNMLNALFERTYSSLSAPAKKIFLTLANWRSIVPVIAFEAIMYRPDNDTFNVEEAIEELVNSSFVEIINSEEDEIDYLSMPLAASMFGKKKLPVSPYKASVMVDSDYLKMFGASQRIDIKHGFETKIQNLIREIRLSIKNKKDIDKFIPILKYIADGYKTTWLYIADLFIEYSMNNEEAQTAVRSYIQSCKIDEDAKLGWIKLEKLCVANKDFECQLHCLHELCSFSKINYEEISNAANRINKLLHDQVLSYDKEETKYFINSIINKLESRIGEATGDDCSRLAWLYMYSQNPTEARKVCKKGIELDEHNFHCDKLLKRLEREGQS